MTRALIPIYRSKNAKRYAVGTANNKKQETFQSHKDKNKQKAQKSKEERKHKPLIEARTEDPVKTTRKTTPKTSR